MSTNEKMLGKESNKKKAHRRYSLLLLALLFIGFATYGTYAYFTSSATTTKGHLTLNGFAGSYTPGGTSGDNFEVKTGDGTTKSGSSNDKEYNPDPDKNGTQGEGNGTFEVVKDNNTTNNQDESANSTQFGEFQWVYVGNGKDLEVKDGVAQGIATATNLLTSSFGLTHLNSYVTSNDDHTQFENVVEGDVFRKTVRLAVNGDSKIPATVKLVWNGKTGEDLAGITGYVYTRIAKQETVEGKSVAAAFDASQFENSITLAKGNLTKEIGTVTSGQYIDVELVVAVNNGVDTTDAQLAKIARQLTIRLDQETNNVIK